MDENIIKMICSEMNRYLNNYQMSKLNEALYKRLDSNDNEISNNEYLDKFINSKKLEGCSDLTIRNYNTHIIKLFEYLNKDIRTVDTEDLRDYLSFYQGINNCNNTTIDGVRRSLSSFFTFLEEEDYIIKSPTRRIHKIKTEKLVKETYSDEVLERLRNKCDNIRNLAIIDLLSSSGMRISELVNLNIEDINFENKSCIVFGKGKKMKEVYFDGKAKLHLQEYLKGVKEFEMVQEGDKIAVCISGGKDSMLLAKCMQELKKHRQVNFELVFLVMDPGYNQINRQKVINNAKLLNIPITIFESNIFEAVEKIDDHPCYVCARMRRGYVYDKVDMNIYNSTKNVNLNTIISYVKNGEKHHFMDDYEEKGEIKNGI